MFKIHHEPTASASAERRPIVLSLMVRILREFISGTWFGAEIARNGNAGEQIETREGSTRVIKGSAKPLKKGKKLKSAKKVENTAPLRMAN